MGPHDTPTIPYEDQNGIISGYQYHHKEFLPSVIKKSQK